MWGRDFEVMGNFKDFIRIENLTIINLTIGGNLGWMKWLKKLGSEKFIFHAIIPSLYPHW